MKKPRYTKEELNQVRQNLCKLGILRDSGRRDPVAGSVVYELTEFGNTEAGRVLAGYEPTEPN